MDARVGILRCRFRLVGEMNGAARLEHIARHEIADSLGNGLERALGDDPAVYVLRRVQSDVVLLLGEGTTDGRVATVWGERIAGDVVRRIADADGDGDLVRFDDQADFVAQFVRDVLANVAWDRWFYGSFARHRAPTAAATVARVLLGNRECAPAVLARLYRFGVLDRVLRELDAETIDLLWGRARRDPADDHALGPLLQAALRVLGSLGFAPPGSLDADDLLRAYRTSSRPTAPDWRDRRALAEEVRRIAAFLVRERLVLPAPRYAETLDATLAGLDWLDAEWLGSALAGLGSDSARPPERPPRVWTTRQRRILVEIAAALASDPALRRLGRGSPESALRLHAAFVAGAPGYADDDLARALIDEILRALDVLATGAYGETANRLRRGDVEGAWAAVPPAAAAAEREAFALLAELGPAGLELAENATDAEPPASTPQLACACAGAALLLRAAHDLRVPFLARSGSHDDEAGFASLFGLLAVHWCGPDAVAAGRLDAGMALLLGFSEPPAVDRLRELWVESEPSRLAALVDALDGAANGGGEPLAAVASAALRAWARWLPGHARSSDSYLLDSFVRRPGWVGSLGDVTTVTLSRQPLDVVLELAGYTAEIDARASLGRIVRFRIEEAS